MTAVLVNIGCGSTWHPSWINLDVRPHSPEVRFWDAGKELPFSDAEIDVCYASHFLEHLTRQQAQTLLRETLRVLRRGGIIRLAVPDLEAIAREYLKVLAQAEKGDSTAVQQYEWITLELLDQLVRAESGGEMGRYLRTCIRENQEYIISRIGCEAKEYIKQAEGQTNGHFIGRHNGEVKGLRHGISSIVARSTTLFRSTGFCLEAMAVGLCGILLGSRGKQAMREGLFHLSGENHRWMYDRFSLRQLLKDSGFIKIRICTAFESQIEGFASYGLDVVGGKVRKPDSLFMEAMKP
jgi:predicted SAM-dependent methyltransferase